MHCLAYEEWFDFGGSKRLPLHHESSEFVLCLGGFVVVDAEKPCNGKWVCELCRPVIESEGCLGGIPPVPLSVGRRGSRLALHSATGHSSCHKALQRVEIILKERTHENRASVWFLRQIR